MEGKILSVDVGTTSLKMGIFQLQAESLQLVQEFSQPYIINVYNSGLFADIEQEKWKKAFCEGCRHLENHLKEVEVISFSGTTPGLTAMDKEGEALYPAILMLDQRSRKQAADITQAVGLSRMLTETANMPVAGGCSLASILWIKENLPEVFQKTACFGHSNTYMVRWLTGRFAIDPSSASLSGVYNTVKNDLTWNKEIAETFGLSLEQFPTLLHSWESVGTVIPSLAKQMGFRKPPEVIIGGNDAVLAAYDAGIQDPGEVMNVNGTCEITLVCLPKCYPSTEYNIRAHVLPNRWLTLYVMNAGGKAFEWFHSVFCSEMTLDAFWNSFLPMAVEAWIDRESTVRYVPFLMGSRYSLEPLRAEFKGMNQETTREELLVALIRGLYEYQRAHLKDIALEVPLKQPIFVTGGAVKEVLIKAKQRWMRNCSYVYREQSSLRGAARLAKQRANPSLIRGL
ncbi:MAG: FGGY family carbohydrate kinase [Spirochaetales bacterium]